jgi:hypothetical protein
MRSVLRNVPGTGGRWGVVFVIGILILASGRKIINVVFTYKNCQLNHVRLHIILIFMYLPDAIEQF